MGKKSVMYTDCFENLRENVQSYLVYYFFLDFILVHRPTSMRERGGGDGPSPSYLRVMLWPPLEKKFISKYAGCYTSQHLCTLH